METYYLVISLSMLIIWKVLWLCMHKTSVGKVNNHINSLRLYKRMPKDVEGKSCMTIKYYLIEFNYFQDIDIFQCASYN